METSHAIAQVRRDIGDPAEMFLTNALADGLTVLFDLPQQNINPVGLLVQYMTGASTVVIQPTIVPGTATTDYPSGSANFPAWNGSTAYVPGNNVLGPDGGYYTCVLGNTAVVPASSQADWGNSQIVYTLDSMNGIIQFSQPIPLNATMTVSGQAWGMFTDEDLESIIHEASRQHCQGQTLTERFRSVQGFITYRDVPKDLHHLPKIEESLVVTLADVKAMWILATDAATDVNVATAEGTNIDRSARYQQLMMHIGNLTEAYTQWCGQLGVGLYRIESLNLRRVSYTNNRLVPIFRDREYDDHRYPVRELPPIDRREEDTSGVPSPIWNGLPL
jgi:hypothetical protein